MKNHQFPTRPFRNGSKKGRFWRFLANFSIFPGGVPRFWQKRVILVEISNMKSPKTSKSPWKKGSAGAILIDFWWFWPFWLVNTQIYHVYLPLAMLLSYGCFVARKGSKSQLNTFKKWVIKEPYLVVNTQVYHITFALAMFVRLFVLLQRKGHKWIGFKERRGRGPA